MKFKRNIAVFMCLVLFMISGCGNQTESVKDGNQTSQTDEIIQSDSTDLAKEKVTLTIFNHNASNLPSNILDNPVMDKIAEVTGVILDLSLIHI